MSKQRTSQRDINAKERQNQALSLRRTGLSLAQIATACGYQSKSSAHKAIRAALKELPMQNAEELRTLEAQRLDDLQAAWWLRAKKDVGALHAVLRIMEQRARLFGICLEPTEVDKPKVVIREIPQMLGLLGPINEQGVEPCQVN